MSFASKDRDENEESFFGRFFRRLPKQSRSRALVEAILDASEELLTEGESADLTAKEGLTGVTVERISDRAGVSPGSFYDYFASEEGLVGALLGRATARNFDDFIETVDAGLSSGTLELAIRATATAVSHRYLDRPKTTRAVFRVAVRLGLLRVLQEDRDRFASQLAARCAPLVDAPPAVVAETMRDVADVVMGMVFAELFRASPEATAVGTRAGDAAWAVVRTRFGP